MLLIVVVLVVLAAATGCGSSAAFHSRPGGSVAGLSVLPLRLSAPQQRAAERQGRAIDKLLRRSSSISKGGRKREIALTFDDGPSADTGRLLGILRRLRVRATFFQVSSAAARFSQLARRELQWGHAVGDHTETHPFLRALSVAAQRREINGAAAQIRASGAPNPRLFRPPFGSFDARTVKITRSAHMLIVLWSVDTRDFSRPGSAAIVHNAVSAARPGAIILMHDGGGPRGQTLAAVPRIVRGLRRRHYSLVSVPELIQRDPPPKHRRKPRSGR